ncbi:MAG: YqaE/Pmp3 family membrane protein [Oligosphaeraceae bacterium]|nr:YqaE/Pmp3 family membrane protein [Oligosphaeraceae bacterium]
MLIRIILCFIFPPLAVIDKGCGALTVVFFLTLLGWVPGTVAALVIAVNDK